MKLEKDAFGHEVMAYFHGEKSIEIVERDDGYIDVSYGPEKYFSSYPQWKTYEKKALRYVRGKTLDIGCGAGRIALHLQKNGFEVIGIDNSPLAIQVSKLRGLKKVKNIGIEDIGKLKQNSFDTIVMFGNNFGLFENAKKAKKSLQKMYQLTTQNACILAESNDPYKTKNPIHLSYHAKNRKRGRMSGQLRLRVRFQKYIGEWFDYLLVSKKEMKTIVQGTGWKIKTFIPSNSSMYIAIIVKE